MIIDFAGTAAPTGYLACDGSAVSRTTYAALFAAISTTWGAGNGTTTFNIPNLQRRVTVGSGGSGTATLANSVGSTGGAETHTLITAEMPSHTHTLTANVSLSSSFGAGGNNAAVNSSAPTTSSTGGDGAHNNMQPSAVMLKCIKT
jgi:microcystin-dependent protein